MLEVPETKTKNRSHGWVLPLCQYPVWGCQLPSALGCFKTYPESLIQGRAVPIRVELFPGVAEPQVDFYPQLYFPSVSVPPVLPSMYPAAVGFDPTTER